MPDYSYTAIMLAVDRSGSMWEIKEAAQEAIRGFIAEQATAAAGGKRTIRIAQFDDVYETVCTSQDPRGLEPFHLHPRGATALLDAMGRSMTEFGAELAAMPEPQRPVTVIFALMTDGKENASVEYTDFDQIKAMVQRQENEFRWQVLYLGANQDAIQVGERLGVRRDRSMTYAATDHGTRSVVGSMNAYVAAASAGGDAAFTDDQREDAAR